MNRSSCFLVLASMLALPVTVPGAQAQDETDVPRPLVLDMTTLTKDPRTEAVQALVSENTPFEPGTYPLLSGASPEFLELFRWLYPADGHLVCEETAGLQEVLEQARSMVVELELDRALVTLRRAFETLPCRHERIEREVLRRIFYFEGIARYYEGDEAGSERAFLASLAIDAESGPVPGFPPDITEMYDRAAARLPELPEVQLEVDAALKQAGVTVDGAPVPELDSRIALRPGFHVAQVFNQDGVARTATFFLDARGTTSLGSLVDIMPPGSTSYLNALFRTSIQQLRLERAQRTALDAYCRLRNHPFIIFVVVSVDTGTQELATYLPGAGLTPGVPDGLQPLPPMVREPEEERSSGRLGFLARRRERKREAEEARREQMQADESGISFGGTSSKPSPEAPVVVTQPVERPERTETAGVRGRREWERRTVARVGVGRTVYEGEGFAGLLPSITLPVAGVVGVHVGLFYGTDFGTRTDTFLGLYGVRVGPEFAVWTGRLVPRLGLGGAFTAARVIAVGDVSKLLVEGTPEGWVGLDYLFEERMLVGLELGAGFSPGFTSGAAAHGLWRGSLTVGWTW